MGKVRPKLEKNTQIIKSIFVSILHLKVEISGRVVQKKSKICMNKFLIIYSYI